jgi:CubicO group peptidase (beta-lactamase class C family)
MFTEPNPRRLRRTLAVVVAVDGRIVAERYAPGITPDTALPGWSMAKSVMNALVGVLVDEGRLRLDQRELMPAWTGHDPRAAITLEDLLRMRSGLRFEEHYGRPWSDVIRMLYGSHDMAAFAASRPLAAAPGTVWQYASGTSNILSAIVRRTVGDAAYHAWPRQVLFEPLGMTSAVLEPDASGTFVGSSYMTATLRDWARFGQLYLDEGMAAGTRVFSRDWVRFTTSPTPQSPDGRYGAHWWVKLNPDIGGDSEDSQRIAGDAFHAVGHEGQTITVIPSRRLVAVRLGASIHIDAWNQAAFTAAVQDAATDI